MEKSESIKEIATALCNFQGAVDKIKKTETNPFFKSKYASLADILDVIRKPLFDNGLSFVQFPTNEHQLTTMLMHVSGEFLSDTYNMQPTKNDPQGLGSVITYQRRYALGSILGLNIDDDDDGNKASTPKTSTKLKWNTNLTSQIIDWMSKSDANTIEYVTAKYEMSEVDITGLKSAFDLFVKNLNK